MTSILAALLFLYGALSLQADTLEAGVRPTRDVVRELPDADTTGTGPAGADSAEEWTRGTLRIGSEPQGALVRLNGADAGFTPFEADTLPAGPYLVEVIPPDSAGWLTRTARDSVFLEAYELEERTYRLAHLLFLQTLPPGAELFAGDSLLGETPVVVERSLFSRTPPAVLRKVGFHPVTLSPPTAAGPAGTLTVSLPRDGDTPLLEDVYPPPSPPGWPKFFAAAGAVAAGGAAAYFKIKADNVYDEYLRTGDPALRNDATGYDMQAAMALIATQACIALLTYLLFTE
jgi:hypothetical protein